MFEAQKKTITLFSSLCSACQAYFALLRPHSLSVKPLIYLVLILCAISTSFSTALTKQKSLLVQKIGPEDGIVGMQVMGVVEDHEGFIWIITDKALHRYDGYTMKVYRHDPDDPNSIPHNDFLSLYIDQNNFLWISSLQGVLRLDPDRRKFTVVDEHSVSRKTRFKEDSKGNVWYLNNDHPFFFDQNDQLFKKVDLYAAFKRKGYGRVFIYTYELISDTEMLIVRFKDTCIIYNIETDEFTEDLGQPLARLCDRSPEASLRGDTIFLKGKDKAIYQYSLVDKTAKKIVDVASGRAVNGILVDSNENIWVATAGELYLRRSGSELVYVFGSEVSSETRMSDFEINGLLEDSQGLIWIPTSGNGIINIYDPRVEKFTYQDEEYKQNIDFNNTLIELLFSDDQGSVWIASAGELNRIDVDTRQMTPVPLVDQFGSPTGIKKISDILQTKDGEFLFATDIGLFIYRDSGDSGYFEKIFPSGEGELPTDLLVISLDEDNNKNIWFGTFREGLFKYDLDTRRYTRYVHDALVETSLLNDLVFHVFVDSKQRVWASTVSGLSVLEDPSVDAFTNFTADIKDRHSVCGRLIPKVIESSEGQILLATKSGLGVYDEVDKTFSCWGENLGLASDTINTIVENPVDSTFFLGTPAGISNIDKFGKNVKSYTTRDGLFGGVSVTAAVFDKNNVLWLGTGGGLNRFKPGSQYDKEAPFRIVLSDIRVNNLPYMESGNVNALDRLELSPSQNTLEFSFAQLDFANLGAHRYKVMLENWDRQWVNVGKSNQVRFSNLPPGDYVLKIALDGDGLNGERYRSLAITINTPIWQTTPAKVLFVLLLLGVVWGIVKIRIMRLQRQALVLERAVQNRTKEVVEQKETIEQLLNQKQELFASVSHEFRTPLTLIVGPVTELIRRTRNKKIKDALLVTLANAKRLLRMVDQLLDLARLDAVTPSSTRTVNVTKLIEEIIVHFDSVISERELIVNFHRDEPLMLNISLDAMEKIVINLFSNAIKYSPKGGCIDVAAKVEHDRLMVSVGDNGIGIAPENHSKVFERFVRVDQSGEENIVGAGIGLALVKQLTESYGGSIQVESALGEGACFTVSFPYQSLVASQEATALVGTGTEQEVDAFRAEHISAFPVEGLVADNNEGQSTLPKVLIIEDHPDMRRFIRQALGQRFQCLEAGDGSVGVKCALEEVPDIIVTDLMMPKKDGFEVAQVIRNDIRTSHIPIIILTANADIKTRMHAWKSDIDEYLEKPFEADELLLRCQNLLTIRGILSRRISAEVSQESDTVTATLNERDRTFLTKLADIVTQHYQDPELGTKLISGQLAVSESQLQRKIKALLRQSVPEYVRHYRLTQAAKLLKQGKRVTDVAFDVGFSNPTYFSTCFKAQYGMTPSDYQSVDK